MQLDFMLLTNYAEVGGNGLLYISGAGWDTINVGAPLPEAPADVFAVIQGTLVIRLLFHATETGREHGFAISITDEDGAEINKLEGQVRVERTPGFPATWDQPLNLPVPLTGVTLPRPGQYRINLVVNGQFVGDKPFRVIKGY
jgi:hypothetical protein